MHKNQDIADKWGDFADTLAIPSIGTFATYQLDLAPAQYEIIGWGAEGDESGITVKARILRVDDNGDDCGEEPKLVDFADLNLI
jgi:hypothetical protein